MRNYALLSLALVSGFAAAEGNAAKDFKLGFGVDQGFSFVGQYQDTYNFAIGNDGVAVDYLFHRNKFESQPNLDWYIGAGGWIGWRDNGGVRVPVGLDLDIGQGWNGYAQLSPGWNFIGNNKLELDAALGVRYSF